MAVDRPAARRDRDEFGRARNGRPRDELGRPLPYGSPHVQRQPEGVERTPADSLTQAQRLLDDGRPFHAHEVFEDAWKLSEDTDRELWKGLAQLAVGVTHIARGNRRGAAALLGRAVMAMEPYAARPPHHIDVAGIRRWAVELNERLVAGADLQALPERPVILCRRL